MAPNRSLLSTSSPRLPFDVLELIVGQLAFNEGMGSARLLDPQWREKIGTLKGRQLHLSFSSQLPPWAVSQLFRLYKPYITPVARSSIV
ncbi:hypothetical protein EIP91_009160 [Steccherinum ochraceum]|uniref:F-box domain-containing protein n=1 Tax=Steccherinum ochraceum TaxID=92696 RepID=A0A4R0RA43_9APHY|nr:hypothetical protein EIP91_009160 [Steccherinum ochraceum]